MLTSASSTSRLRTESVLADPQLQRSILTVLDEWKPQIKLYADYLGLDSRTIIKAACNQLVMEPHKLFTAQVDVTSVAELNKYKITIIGGTSYQGKIFGHGVKTVSHNTSNQKQGFEFKSTAIVLDTERFLNLEQSVNGRDYLELIRMVYKIANHDLLHQVTLPEIDFHYYQHARSQLSWVTSNLLPAHAASLSKLGYFSELNASYQRGELPASCFEIGPLAIQNLAITHATKQPNEHKRGDFAPFASETIDKIGADSLSILSRLFINAGGPKTLAVQDLCYDFSVLYRGLCIALGPEHRIPSELRAGLVALVPADFEHLKLEDLNFRPNDHDGNFSYLHTLIMQRELLRNGGWFHPIDAAALQVLYSGAGLWRHIADTETLTGRPAASLTSYAAKIIQVMAALDSSCANNPKAQSDFQIIEALAGTACIDA